MNIAEMHVWFRQYAQQMGLQNVRAILPEQIDLVINTSVTDTINQLIRENIGITNDRIITDNSKIGQINALRSLYKVLEVDATPGEPVSEPSSTPLSIFTKGNETFIRRIYASIPTFETIDGKAAFDYLFLVDLSLNYIRNGENRIHTNYFPIRIIDDAYLSDTLNDFILRPRLRTPVAVIYNDQLDIYIDELQNGNLPQNLTPNKLRVSYIAKPAIVRYAEDIGGTNVDCNLPEYLHIEVLKHAVDLWRVAVSGSLHANQQQEQAQQQEVARNNYRNEGNQV